MPGPWFTNNESASGLNQTEPRTYTVWGTPPQGGNVGSDDSPIDSRLLSVPIEHARALRYALDGTETDGDLGDPASITAGHLHEEAYDGHMPWLQLGSWQYSTVAGGVSTEVRAVWKTTSTSYADVMFVPLCVPIGVTRVYPRFIVEIAGSATGGVLKWDFYSFGSYTTAAVIGGELTTPSNSSVTSIRRTLSSDNRGNDVSGIATTLSHRLLVLRVQAKSLDGGTFSLYETQLLASPIDYRAYPTRDNLDTTNAQSDVTLTQAKAATLFVSNPAVLRKVTYGTTLNLPTRSSKHDHAENRGEVLKHHFFSTCYGPHTKEGAAYSATVGLPLNEPDTSVDFTSTPKLIVRQACPVPGQIASVRVVVTGYLAGSAAPRTVGLTVELRPLDEDYSEPGAQSGVSDTITLSTASDGFVSGAVTLNTVTLGDCSGDRVFELCLWQTTNPASTETYRLCGACAFYRSGPDDSVLRERATLDASESVPYSQIRTGQELTGHLLQRAARVLHQCSYEILGGVQGYETDAKSVNPAKPWRRRLKPNTAHQHRGSYTDVYGALVDDGAVLRYPLLCQHFGANIAGDATENATSDVNQTLGQKLHASGALNSTDWLYTGGICTIAQGLGAIEIKALIQPAATNPRARLYCFATVVSAAKNIATPEIATNIATTIRSGPYEGTDNYSAHSSAGEVFCEVLPEESAPWMRNERRLQQGLGCWTLDALRQNAIDSRWLQTNAARWTEPVRVEISPTGSVSYRVRVRWALQTGDPAIPTAGTYQSDARILALLVLPARGY